MEATVSEVGAAAPGRRRRRAQTWLFSIALLVLALGTAGGVLLARQRAAETVDERAQEAAEAAAALLETEIRQVFAGLAGADAIVDPDGQLDLDVFESFAAGLLTSEGISRLALLEVVPRSGAPAGYLAVAAVPPEVATVGRDFGEDATRRSALDATVASRTPTVTGLLTLTIAGEPGVAFLRPLSGPDGTVAGVIDTAVTQERIGETLRGSVGPEMGVTLLDGESIIVGDELDPRVETFTATLEVRGRDWKVVVRPGEGADLTVAWLVGAGGAAATLAMAALLVITERHQRAQARANLLLTRAEERSRAAQEVAGRLARALTGAEVAGALMEHLPAAVGARSARIATVDPRSGGLRIVTRDGEAGGEAGVALPAPEPGSVIDQVLVERQAAWLSSPLGWRNDEVTTLLAGDGSALAVLPLLTADVAGVLAVSYPQFHIFADDEQALLGTVGVLAAQALARGQRYDAEHQAAVAFQRAALPDELPAVEGLTIAARYRPATHGATVGGDWYDVLVLDEYRVMLVVGDVVGHGMVAAAAMGRLRTAFQTIVPFTRDPGEMLQAIGQQVGSIPDAFCTTVVTVVVDLRTGAMTWARAGHPPPLHVDRAGAHLLDSPGVPPLGVVPEAEPRVHDARLHAGDLVILYTDGVVERRSESLDQGFQRLGIVAEQLADLDPEELCDALVEALVPAEEQTDDLAVLVVRFDRPHA